MSGITDLRDAFAYAAGSDAKLTGTRMRYGDDGIHILEFDISYNGGEHTLVDTCPPDAKMQHLVAKAVQLGTRAREGVASGKPPAEWGGTPVATAIDNAVEKIMSGKYEMVHDLAHTDPDDPTPPVFF